MIEGVVWLVVPLLALNSVVFLTICALLLVNRALLGAGAVSETSIALFCVSLALQVLIGLVIYLARVVGARWIQRRALGAKEAARASGRIATFKRWLWVGIAFPILAALAYFVLAPRSTDLEQGVQTLVVCISTVFLFLLFVAPWVLLYASWYGDG